MEKKSQVELYNKINKFIPTSSTATVIYLMN